MNTPPVRGRLSLTGSLFIGYVLLLALALAAVGTLWVVHLDRVVDRHHADRVLSTARSVAVMPDVVEGLRSSDPAAVLDPLADGVAAATGAEFVVIASPEGIRHSHPDDDLIGRTVSTPPGPAARGREWTGVQEGTQGRSVRAKVPVFSGGGSVNGGDDRGEVIGYVSLGVLTSSATTEARAAVPAILGMVAVVLLLGVGGAWVLSRQVRAKTHGLEPADITALLESREALLYAVREGVLAVDGEGRLVLANQPVRDMLGLPEGSEGHRLDGLGLSERVRDIVSGDDPGDDRILLAGHRVLVANRMPVRVRGEDAGAVVTFRDRTELDRLTGELDGARTVTRGLRAQTHEFANRVHTLAGMLELGAYDEARAYLADLSATHTRTSTDISEHVADSALAALAIAKSAQASEMGVDLRLSPMTSVPALDRQVRSDALLVLGNLVDNALDAVVGAQHGWVELMVRLHTADTGGLPHDLLEIRVTDSGHGVADDVAREIFRLGFTTKASRDGGTRGLGLALVKQVCEGRGGSVEMEAPDADEGAVFTACLPLRVPAAAEGAAP
ncbi:MULTISPECIES: ATP-binding protein [Nocardiopsis]|uniref:histidine kinase n=1 Tax=Nocardiopsis sinuspersici TaxID=501010 RepID=A0A1V3C7C9_9ACTN|nr:MULTISPECIES: sensor histidine kinase [Nocardiopsis]NYH53336.1 two-component system CitB family sensor kinase [Nocardiopsis sinuspersici]OOC56677.1 histidine kinase [Nocardiopsis sinuspersici]